MKAKILFYSVNTFMLIFGFFLASNIYVIGDLSAAVEMHQDLAPGSPAWLIYGKVLICFIAGLLYAFAAICFYRKKTKFARFGLWATVLFIGFYIIELIGWSGSHPEMWMYFGIMGTISFLFGVFSNVQSKRTS